MGEQADRQIDTLYRVYSNDLFMYALGLGFDRETAMDAIHDVFYKLCLDENIVKGVTNIRFYLLRSLKNRLLDINKLKREIPGLSIGTIAEEIPFSIHVNVEDLMIENEEREKIRLQVEKLLESLTDRQREVIYLRFTQDCDYEEIALLMHISVPSCRKLFHKAITSLKKNPPYFSILLFFLLRDAFFA
ncbi:DNA-directed RNA polymerase sigma-70 factor [Bacteroidia bacterium]|nr:DNA-directed RNA polymerase sigma-70 factor [Bacteroidia bacterium]